ncbi:MAG: lysophospholipid acyltransferase family protein [Pseudomonadota bacterium]
MSSDLRMAPWLRAVSSLPLPVLYALTGAAIFLIHRVLRLRVDVVYGNIGACFPELDKAAVARIATGYYRQVGQMVAEAFKAGDMPAAELTRRVTVSNLALAQDLLAQGRPILLIAAHQANWEWALHTMALHLGYPLDVGYKPIRSAWAERAMYVIRSRFGAHMVPAKELLPDLLKRRHIVRGIAMLADQEPTSSDHKHWVKFLGRDTAFYMGAEQMARATRYASLFVALRRVRRGWYELSFTPLAAAGEQLEPGEFTARYARLVEAQILAAPADWTWSHRRWKLKKGVYGAR